jgi:uncharacterized membrane protein YiaA
MITTMQWKIIDQQCYSIRNCITCFLSICLSLSYDQCLRNYHIINNVIINKNTIILHPEGIYNVAILVCLFGGMKVIPELLRAH